MKGGIEVRRYIYLDIVSVKCIESVFLILMSGRGTHVAYM